MTNNKFNYFTLASHTFVNKLRAATNKQEAVHREEEEGQSVPYERDPTHFLILYAK